MSMILGLNALSDTSIDRVLETPELLYQVLEQNDPQPAAEIPPTQQKPSFFARMFGMTTPHADPVPDATINEESSAADLEKAWHGIHFLLTNSDWDGDPPLNFLITGGIEIEEVDYGYGPARIFRSAEVAEIHKSLDPILDKDLEKSFDPNAMTEKEIYPSIWHEGDDALEYLLYYFAELKSFINNTANKKLGMAIVLC